MQIRPGVSLLQAIAKASEPAAVPFSERLADMRAAAAPGRPGAAAASVQARPIDAKPAVTAPPADPAPAASAPIPAKPRGSLLDIVV